MKNILLTIAALLAVVFSLQAQENGNTMFIISNNGDVYRKAVKDVKEVLFADVESEEYVDLGLPSGKKWATRNVGAKCPEDPGDYFAWGETEPYYTHYDSQLIGWKKTPKDYSAGYTWANYFDTPSDYSGDDAPSSFTTYNTTGAKLQPEHDAATSNWGSKWRMPTHAEWVELVNNCYWEWTNGYNGVPGYIVYKAKNIYDKGTYYCPQYGGTPPRASYSFTDAYIFLPAMGVRIGTNLHGRDEESNYYSADYWSSELSDYNASFAWYLTLSRGPVNPDFYDNRCNGCSVRAVYVP